MMDNMNYAELHSKHFEHGLKIRAICDDLEYPAEYAHIFLYIHIRGIEHCHDETVRESMSDILEEYYDPESQRKLKESRSKEDSKTRKLFSNIVIGEEFQNADNFLLKKENTNNFFSKQINNIRRLYTDKEYRKKMLRIYEKNIKKLINSYDKEKVEKVFERARLLNGINFN